MIPDTTGSRLATVRQSTGTTFSTASSASFSLSSSSSPTTSFRGGGATGGAGLGAGDELKEGDAVAIAVDEHRLKELQADFGGATAGMIEVRTSLTHRVG